jgi:glutamate/tyrosine decarboxylase-like PLP-dependent enzyme
VTAQSKALFIGGRAGAGKSSTGYETHAQLSAARIQHCLIEGDNLDMAWPAPHENGLRLAEQNLAAMWANYRALGYRRMIYTNTASALEKVISELTAAMGDSPQVTAVLLTCSDATARQRLAQRETGSGLGWHIERSDLMARRLDRHAPAWVHRVTTDSRALTDIAAEIIALTGWTSNNHPADPDSTRHPSPGTGQVHREPAITGRIH